MFSFDKNLSANRSFLLVGALCVLLAWAAPLTVSAAPQSPVVDTALAFDDGADQRAAVLEHRRLEAERKALAAIKKIRGDEQRTENQDQYDVVHYDIDLDLNPSTHILTGTVATTAEVVGTSLATCELHLANNLNVSAVTAGGVATTYTHGGGIVTVNLDRTYVTGETFVVTVTYSGNPQGDAFDWDSHSGQHLIWTLSEPYGARTWWPCKDLNVDKADSADIRVTVPDNLIVASNGRLISDVDHGSTRTFHWHSGNPIVTYLISLAIHPYVTFSDWYNPLVGEPMEIQHFVFADHYDDVQANYALLPPMIGLFALGFGEYPFLDEKYGHAEFGWGGGMEHQTCSSMGGWSEDLISHELAHQWFGDSITCETFHHIWLNEGFATWCEAYWKEETEGFDVYQTYMDYAAYFGSGTIFVEDPENFGDIFNWNLTYNKASWVVHMLRGVVGDTAFFTGLRQYLVDFGGSTATTEQFRDLMEDVSGVELDAFFQQWIYGPYYPNYHYSWSRTSETTIELTVEQTQTNTGLFTMPIQVRVATAGGDVDFVVQNSLATETYELTVSGDILSVQLDPDDWILCQKQSGVSNPSFDLGILLVNGVDWNTYGAEITSAYEARAFWGDNPITFWDTFNAPSGGYPSTLPEPAGHGAVPGDLIGRYSTVIWVGNNYNGDLTDWLSSPVAEYLELGGNVLLMTRYAREFVTGPLTGYLGVTWAEGASSSSDLHNYIAVHPDLIDITFTGSQNYVDVFYTQVAPESTLLFKDTLGFSGERGVGVHAQPAGGGLHRPDGARFVLLSGRPYRMAHAALRTNVETILSDLFGEPYQPPLAVSGTLPTKLALGLAYPNPFNPQTVIPFALPAATEVELAVYDVSGRLVRTLAQGRFAGGEHQVRWDGNDATGSPAAAGVYFVHLRSGGDVATRKLVLAK